MLRLLLLRTVRAVWRARVTSFWPIWITIAVAAAVWVAWVVRQPATPTFNKAEKASVARLPRYVWSRSAVAALTLLSLFLACYIAETLIWEDFAYYDNSMFTVYTLRGHNISPSIWPQIGRLFPLGYQEFNIIRHFTRTAVGYHILPIIQLLILSCLLLSLDDELRIRARAGLAAIALITPAILISFGGLIYPERNLLLSLALLALFVKRFEETQSSVCAMCAAVSAQIMLYYKETACLLLLGFAAGRLILRCRTADEARWDFSRLTDEESRLDVCFSVLALLFLLYYGAVMFPHLNFQYAVQARRSLAEVLFSYLKQDLLAWLLVATVISRVYRILRHKGAPLLLWDGLGLGGVVYFAAYLFLRMFSGYYLAPVDFIAVLYVGRLAILSWGKTPQWGRVVAFSLLSFVLIQDISLSAFRVFERKNVIHAKAEISRVVETQHGIAGGSVQRLFFPFASPYVVMEFTSYLSYRGVPMEEVAGGYWGNRGIKDVEVVSPAIARDGLCITSRPFVCHAGSRPGKGDLVIVLPDDDASLAEVTAYREPGELLFSYAPYPLMAPWMDVLVRRLHIASPLFAHRALPDRWLHASVTVWK